MENTNVEMEVDAVQDNVLATNVTASVSISLHPLVILNISEHWTRITAQVGGHSVPTLGALIGKQKDRNIEIMNSFELSYNILDDSTLVIDRDYYNSKEEQFKQVSYYDDCPRENNMVLNSIFFFYLIH